MEYSPAAWERAMRMQDVILRAISGEISWFAAADILQMTPRNLRRWRERYERWRSDGGARAGLAALSRAVRRV
jgi:helix-turn-helix protein